MQPRRRTFVRSVAILACLAMLYFAAAGSVLHHHTGGPDTACSVCHALHVPALAVAALHLFSQDQQVTWHASATQSATPLDSFALHRASRAPPSA